MRLTILAGLPKTGSSFLQSALVDLSDQLTEYGIRYPFLGTPEIELRRVGNGKKIHQQILYEGLTENAVERIIQSANISKLSLLLAHESFYNSLPFLTESNLKTLRRAGFENISLILYFREPKEWAFRIYKQHTRYGRILSFEQFWKSWDGIKRVERLIKWTERNSDMCSLKVVSYRAVSTSLLRNLLTYGLLLNDDRAQALEESISRQVVNRSLSLCEIRFIQTAAYVSPWIARRISLLLERLAIKRDDRSGFVAFCSEIPAEREARLNALTERLASLDGLSRAR